MAPNRFEHYTRALAWGCLCGLRTLSGPVLASHHLQSRLSRSRWQRQLAKPRVVRTLEGLALLELVADKLPFTPPRTQLPALLARAASGAVTAFVLAAPHDAWSALGVPSPARRRQKLAQALAGAAAAVVSAGVAYRVRRLLTRRWQLSPLASGLMEDAVVLLAARLGR